MSREITPSEITPGAFIRFTEGGFTVQARVNRVERKSPGDAYRVWSNGERYVLIDARTPVEVFEEQQPTEPTAFGALVETADGGMFARVDNDAFPWLSEDECASWKQLSERGQITVIAEDPFNHGD